MRVSNIFFFLAMVLKGEKYSLYILGSLPRYIIVLFTAYAE